MPTPGAMTKYSPFAEAVRESEVGKTDQCFDVWRIRALAKLDARTYKISGLGYICYTFCRIQRPSASRPTARAGIYIDVYTCAASRLLAVSRIEQRQSSSDRDVGSRGSSGR